MNNEYIRLRTETIKNVFKDTRELEYAPQELQDSINLEGDLFITPDGEIVYLDLQTDDFDAEELANYAEMAENLYEKHQKRISIYLLCPDDVNVSVRECQIKSEADFSIKLACIEGNPIIEILNIIQRKIKKGESLTQEDLDILEIIPMMAPKEKRKELRVECFRIMNGI